MVFKFDGVYSRYISFYVDDMTLGPVPPPVPVPILVLRSQWNRLPFVGTYTSFTFSGKTVYTKSLRSKYRPFSDILTVNSLLF